MKIPYFLVLLMSRVRSQDVSTPSSQLQPRNHNHHPFDAEEFLKSLKAEPTKQGPVLFPNDGPRRPRPPLIVTSRPLVESIARSELGQSVNNTETSQSQINGQVSFSPYLARVQDYRPYVPSPTYNYNFVPTQIPYAEVVKKGRLTSLERDNRYNNYEEQTILPPVYKALSDYAKQKVLKLKEKKHNFNYQAPVQDFPQNYQNNGINENNSDYDQNQNYAFSYRVNDKKTGDDFSHSQHSSGSATNGEYRVRLPDGRMQIVSYTADENGYKADVRYDEDDKTGGNRIDNQNGYRNNDYVDRNNAHNNNGFKYRSNNVIERKHNDYTNNNNAFIDKNNNFYVVKNNIDYTDTSHKDYTDIEKKEKAVNERDDYYNYPDASKEYYNDYSSEYNSNYEPHKSKFTTFANNEDITNKGIASTVKPSYEELKDLFATKDLYNTQQNYDSVELKVPSTTALPYEGTTEHVVLIGNRTPNLYTDIKNSIPHGIPSYATPRVVVASTPQSYLVSTIASLKNKVHLSSKPVLSDRFIDKINKYLSFN